MIVNTNRKLFNSNIFFKIALVLCLIYSYTFCGLTPYIYGSNKISIYSLITVAIIVCLYIIFSKKVIVSIQYGLYLLLVCIVLFNNYNIKNQMFHYEVLFVILFAVYIGACQSSEWINLFYNFSIFASMIFAVCTIWFYFDEAFYRGVVMPLFPQAYQTLNYTYTNGQMAGLTWHYSTNAMYLSTGLGICLARFISCDKWRHKKRSLIFIGVLLIALLLTGKRAHIIFCFAAIMIVFYLYHSNRPTTRIFKILGIISVISLVFVVISMYFPPLVSFITRFIETAKDGDVTLGRFDLASRAWTTFIDNPMFGAGWDWFKYNNYTSEGNINVHNVYIQLLCETGVIGFCLFFIFFIIHFIYNLRLLKSIRCRKTEVQDIQNVEIQLSISLFVQAFFLMYCLTGNPLYDPPMLVPYILCCAITARTYQICKLRSKE